MGLGMWLLEKTVDKAVEGAFNAAEKASDKKAEAKREKAKQEKQQQAVKAKQEKQQAAKAEPEKNSSKTNEEKQETVAAPNYTEYDVRLVCAKVAICGYIIYADNQLSEAESDYINYVFGGILNEYGQEVYDKAVKAYQNSAKSFMNLQDYLRKVNLKDVKLYLKAADEVAEVDGVDESEKQAIQRIKDYIEEQETGSAHYLVCPACSGMMSIDDYGYKAICNSCGREVIVDSSNAPSSAYREINKPTSAVENKPSTDEKPEKKEAVETAEPAKSKKGKVALKVAVGVMTGGVSLIPDAVDAVKKKGKKNSQ